MRLHELPPPLLFVVHAKKPIDRRAISYQSLTSMQHSSNGSSRDAASGDIDRHCLSTDSR
jgi:hypothetical protein